MITATLTFFLVFALIACFVLFVLVTFLGWAIAPLIGNIIAGGALYFFIDAFNIIKMDWTFFDALVIALFGVPGTLFLAILEAF